MNRPEEGVRPEGLPQVLSGFVGPTAIPKPPARETARARGLCTSDCYNRRSGGSDGRDSLGYVPDDGIETLPPGLPLPDPDRTGIERGPATQVV